MIFENFKNGINFGGWLSQYDCLNPSPINRNEMKEHLETFITAQDVGRVAAWGFDHIRVPFDYRTLEEEPDSLVSEKDTFDYMDRLVSWCKTYHLNIVFDLHNAAGNVYGKMDEPMPLLTEENYKMRFMHIWERMAIHFKGQDDVVIMFELLNEVSDGSGYLWNELYRETVAVIHKIDPNRPVLIGSNEANSPFTIQELDLLDDPYVYYNFHFYDPQVFTHQRAHFSEEMMAYNRKVHYPDKISDFTDFLMNNRVFIPKYHYVAMEERVDKDSMKALLKKAINFTKYSGKELYCGEFGVIDTADAKDAVEWIKDCKEILEENHIGHAMWNYKALDFGFINLNGDIMSEERVESLFI